jgi:hypothetical protein
VPSRVRSSLVATSELRFWRLARSKLDKGLTRDPACERLHCTEDGRSRTAAHGRSRHGRSR